MTSARNGSAKVSQPSKKGDKKNSLFSKKGIDKSINRVYNKDTKSEGEINNVFQM